MACSLREGGVIKDSKTRSRREMHDLLTNATTKRNKSLKVGKANFPKAQMLQIWRTLWTVGLREYLRQVWVLGSFRGGRLVGRDELGNRYYEVVDEQFKNRYVEYADGSEEASRVPSKWHAWLHRTTDDLPEASPYPEPTFYAGHRVNVSGTRWRYVPWSTTGPKYEGYRPSTKSPPSGKEK